MNRRESIKNYIKSNIQLDEKIKKYQKDEAENNIELIRLINLEANDIFKKHFSKYPKLHVVNTNNKDYNEEKGIVFTEYDVMFNKAYINTFSSGNYLCYDKYRDLNSSSDGNWFGYRKSKNGEPKYIKLDIPITVAEFDKFIKEIKEVTGIEILLIDLEEYYSK